MGVCGELDLEVDVGRDRGVDREGEALSRGGLVKGDVMATVAMFSMSTASVVFVVVVTFLEPKYQAANVTLVPLYLDSR